MRWVLPEAEILLTYYLRPVLYDEIKFSLGQHPPHESESGKKELFFL
jgi:hypothetical protein